MTLQFYNTLTRKKEPFTPIDPECVRVYVCGVTVWGFTHLGNGRAATVFDMLVRYLRFRGYTVKYTRNFTDVDDKIINRANEEGVTWKEIAEKYTAAYTADMTGLGNIMPDEEPKASEHIEQMIAQIEELIANDKAYAVGGDVFYAVRSFPEYGKLSGKKIEELEVGARIQANDAKRDPLDFALWKSVKPGEPSWPSPWGEGRPGWHIECSAMSKHHLGLPFDIHGGGRDLIFPHHENEIAQAEGATGDEFCRCWMHNGSLTIDSEKMSKSVGNIFLTSEALKKYDAEVLRYFLFSCHYRSPLDFSEQALNDAQKALTRLNETTVRLGDPQDCDAVLPDELSADAQSVVDCVGGIAASFVEAMDDDLNSAKAFALLFDAVREINKYLDGSPDAAVTAWIQQQWCAVRAQYAEVFGVLSCSAADFLSRCSDRAMADAGVDAAAIEALIEQRKSARAVKDFAAADAARDQLTALGVTIKDNPDGTTTWSVG